MESSKKLIARWESRSGKHWVELYLDNYGFFFTAPGSGGSLGSTIDKEDAIASLQARIARGEFQPDANKTPLRRVGLTPD